MPRPTRLTLVSWTKDALSEARELLPDQEMIKALIRKAVQLAPRLPDVSLTELKILVRMVRAWMARQYVHLPTATLLKVLAALIYFVNPGDILPDPVPGGLIDDAAVLAWTMRSIQGELERFRIWEAQQSCLGTAEEDRRDGLISHPRCTICDLE